VYELKTIAVLCIKQVLPNNWLYVLLFGTSNVTKFHAAVVSTIVLPAYPLKPATYISVPPSL